MKVNKIYLIVLVLPLLWSCGEKQSARTDVTAPLSVTTVLERLATIKGVPTIEEMEEVLALCDSVIATDTCTSHRADNYTMKIMVLESMQRYADALACRCEYVSTYPDGHPVRIIHRYYCEMMDGDSVAARRSLVSVIGASDSMSARGDYSGLIYKAEALMRLGRDEEAKLTLAEMESRYPENGNLRGLSENYDEFKTDRSWINRYLENPK